MATPMATRLAASLFGWRWLCDCAGAGGSGKARSCTAIESCLGNAWPWYGFKADQWLTTGTAVLFVLFDRGCDGLVPVTSRPQYCYSLLVDIKINLAANVQDGSTGYTGGGAGRWADSKTAAAGKLTCLFASL